ncbi:MAG: DNA recombination protein RmuC [Tannerella sp.]|nr:DNA recombination protein RmuC [Tannerella sp.]
MITTILIAVLIILTIVNIIVTLTKKNVTDIDDVLTKLNSINSDMSKIDYLIRDEFGRNREENQKAFKENREELSHSFKTLGETLTKTVAELSNAQKNQFDTFAQQLNNLVKVFDEKLKNLIEKSENEAKDNRNELNHSFKMLSDNLTKTLKDLSDVQLNQFELYSNRLSELTKTFDDKTRTLQEQHEKSAKDNRTEQTNSLKSFEDKFTQNVKDFNELQRQKFDNLANIQDNIKKETEVKLKEIRETIERKLAILQEDNNKKLEEMRKTVDEKLQESVEKRFNESFKIINERLEAVHKGLGEMQTLATGVGDLKKVLTNVKTRGTFGEIQLGAILEQFLSPEQFVKNDHPDEDRKVVEYAIKLPGKSGDGESVLLPVDSKFPVEDYQRLMDAYDNNIEMVETIGRQFENSVKKCAKDICEKYIQPPKTTDFAILFVPAEGLYAEILRRPGFIETLQQNFKVIIVGPTNLVALLNSLQMGFRTLAIEKRSSEVWKILGAVKTEFGKFNKVLLNVKKNLEGGIKNIDDAVGTRTNVMMSKLKAIHELPEEESKALLEENIEMQENSIFDDNAYDGK